jgi:hypothetical protein
MQDPWKELRDNDGGKHSFISKQFTEREREKYNWKHAIERYNLFLISTAPCCIHTISNDEWARKKDKMSDCVRDIIEDEILRQRAYVDFTVIYFDCEIYFVCKRVWSRVRGCEKKHCQIHRLSISIILSEKVFFFNSHEAPKLTEATCKEREMRQRTQGCRKFNISQLSNQTPWTS